MSLLRRRQPAMTTTPVTETIQSILDREADEGARFSPARYPFTYAYDFFAAHADDFDMPQARHASRGETAQHVRDYVETTGQDRVQVLIALADAYLSLHQVVASDESKAEALAYQRQVAWRSMGLDAPEYRAHGLSCDAATPCTEHAR